MDYPRKKSFAAEVLKKRQKKTPTLLVIAVIVAVIAVGYALYMRFGTKEIPTETIAPPTEEIIEKKPSIAVLPFRDMSQEKSQGHLCEGIAEAIIDALARLDDINVAAQTSAFLSREKGYDIPEIGKKLSVETVLEGSIQREGNQLRIIAQLIKVSDGYHLWSETFDRPMDSIFAIQDEISLAIVEKFKGSVSKDEEAVIKKRPTDNLEAYDLYMMGRYFTIRWRFKKALDYYLQAVEKDSSFAAAYAEIAFSYAIQGRQSSSISPGKLYTEAKKALDRAFELDDTRPSTYVARAMISMYYEWDWRTAEENFKKALAIDPNYMTTYVEIDNLLVLLGKEQEALELQRKTLEIDPLSLGVMADTLPILGYLGHYEEAEQIYQKMVVIDSTWGFSYWYAGFIYAAQGKYEEAIATFKKRTQLSGYRGPDQAIGYVYGLMGKRAEAEKILAEIQREGGYVRGENIIRLGLKDFEPIFETLENLYNERNPTLSYQLLDCKRWSKEIVSDPRWKTLMKKMGLPE